MIAVQIDEDNYVIVTNYMPVDPQYGLGVTKEEAESRGWIFFESEPEPENNGKAARLKYNPENGALYYEYIDIPEPEETQLAKMQRQIDTLTAKAAALATGQEMQEDVITEIVMHVYE